MTADHGGSTTGTVVPPSRPVENRFAWKYETTFVVFVLHSAPRAPVRAARNAYDLERGMYYLVFEKNVYAHGFDTFMNMIPRSRYLLVVISCFFPFHRHYSPAC